MRARLALDDDTFMAALAPADRSFLRAVYDAGLAELDGVDSTHRRRKGQACGCESVQCIRVGAVVIRTGSGSGATVRGSRHRLHRREFRGDRSGNRRGGSRWWLTPARFGRSLSLQPGR